MENKSVYQVNSVFGEPMEAFEEEKQRKHCHKFWTEVVSENRERQTCLCYRVPTSFEQML